VVVKGRTDSGVQEMSCLESMTSRTLALIKPEENTIRQNFTGKISNPSILLSFYKTRTN
jgi:hypothetical protein